MTGKDDPTKEREFQKVIGRMLATAPKPRETKPKGTRATRKGPATKPSPKR